MLEPNDDGNLTLLVSNQSFAVSEVDLEVRIDGEIAVTAEFAPPSGVSSHPAWCRYTFQLDEGPHTIAASSSRAEERVEQEIELDRPLWVMVAFWTPPEGDSARGYLTLHVETQAPALI